MPTVAKQKQQKPKKDVLTPNYKDQRPVIYPELRINGAPFTGDDQPTTMVIDPRNLKVTAAKMRDILGWETESEWVARKKAEDPTLAKADLKFENNDPPIEPLLTDENGERIVCHNNRGNRPFNEKTARKYAQDILTRNWAGSNNGGKVKMVTDEGTEVELDDLTTNGETIIVGRTGEVESGQRRGVGLILATQIWAKNRHKWAKNWPEEPYIEALIIFGVSENPRVVRTLDTQDPRTLGDTIYTSPIFSDLTLNSERKEASWLLDTTIDLVWKRVRAEDTYKYQTHSASFDFLNCHKKLIECVRELYEVNRGDKRPISNLKLYGLSAACLYLMGSSSSDLDDYRNANPAPSEKKLSWDNWTKALEFWKSLADLKDKTLLPVRKCIEDLYTSDEGTPRAQEKIMILSKAWKLYVDDQPIKWHDLELHYRTNENGSKTLLDDDTFGGIDQGHKPEKRDDNVSEEEADKTKKEIDKERERLAEASVQKVQETVIRHDGQPATKRKPLTRKEVETKQTSAARSADANSASPKKVGGVIVNAGNKSSIKK